MTMTRLVVGAVLLLFVAGDASAQNPPGGAQPGRGGGGGRGRGGVRVMTLASSAFRDGGVIPVKHAQPGDEASPPLSWTGAPGGDSTKSFVLVVHDLDAIGGNGDDVLHWLVWNIPGSATSLPQGIPQGGEVQGMRQISVTGPYYRGPAAPQSGPPHHYVFELYALDTLLDVPAVGASPPMTRAAVTAAMAGHVRAKGVLVGLFRRSEK